MYFFGITVISYSLITWQLSDKLTIKMNGFLEQHKLVNNIELKSSMVLSAIQAQHVNIHGDHVKVMDSLPEEYLLYGFKDTY
jgi:hypothetical protein